MKPNDKKELLRTKVKEGTLKALGEFVIEELNVMDTDELKDVIVNAQASMKKARADLEANPKYQDLKTRLSDCTVGKREVDKYQKAKQEFAFQRLEDIGKLGTFDKTDFEVALFAARRDVVKKRREQAEKVAALPEKDRPAPTCRECNKSTTRCRCAKDGDGSAEQAAS